MKSEVILVNGAETARGGKEEGYFPAKIKEAVDGFLARGGKGFTVLALNVAADITSNLKRALVTIIYDGEVKAAKTAK